MFQTNSQQPSTWDQEPTLKATTTTLLEEQILLVEAVTITLTAMDHTTVSNILSSLFDVHRLCCLSVFNSNKHLSIHYCTDSNDNGSTYYNSGRGSATYTSPSGQSRSYSTNK